MKKSFLDEPLGVGPWQEGPPPSAGWWPASFRGVSDSTLRYYDGKCWRGVVCLGDMWDDIQAHKAYKAPGSEYVWWRNRAKNFDKILNWLLDPARCRRLSKDEVEAAKAKAETISREHGADLFHVFASIIEREISKKT